MISQIMRFKLLYYCCVCSHVHIITKDDRESVNSCGSNASARTHGSTRSSGSRNPPRPSSVAHLAPTGSGAITEADFEKAFSSHSRLNVSQCDCLKSYFKPS